MAHFLCHLGCSHFGALLLDFHFTENMTVGAVQAKLPMYNIQSMKILVPPTKVISDFQKKMNALDEQIEANTMEIQKLNELRSVLLAKLSD